MKLKEENEGFPYYDLLYSLKKKREELEELPPEDLPSTNKIARFTPVALMLITWMRDEKFSFLELLFYHKVFQKGHNSRYSNRKIKECYSAYFQAIRELKELGDPKEYVLSAFMLQQYEPMLEHMIAACLAKCKESWRENIRYNADMNKLRIVTGPWWNCETIHHNYDFDGSKIKTKYRLYFKTAGDYYNLMTAATTRDHEEAGRLNFNHYERKVIVFDILEVFFRRNINAMLGILENETDYPTKLYNPFECDIQARKVFSNTIYRPWTNEDYVAAKNFFCNEYPIIENHISFQLGDPLKWPNTMIESIRD